MKKPILLSMSLVFLMFMSCSMEESDPEVTLVGLLTEFQIEKYFQSDGSEDQNMDKLLYEIVETYEYDILNPANFPKYIELFKEYKEVHLFKILSPHLQTEIESFEQGLKIREEEYVACMMIPNIDVADFSLSPIIAPGVEIDYKGIDLVGEVIVGWYYNEKGIKQFIHLDESLATTIKRPVIIITNDDQTETKITSNPVYPKLKKSISFIPTTFPFIEDFMISERFESPGRSDVNLAMVGIDYFDSPYGWYAHKKIKDVHEDYLGIYQSCDIDFGDWYRLATNLKTIYMVTYEKDWNRSYKDVTFPDYKTFYGMCKMKNTTDYYVRTFARYDTNGDLDYIYGAQQQIIVIRDNGGLVFDRW